MLFWYIFGIQNSLELPQLLGVSWKVSDCLLKINTGQTTFKRVSSFIHLHASNFQLHNINSQQKMVTNQAKKMITRSLLKNRVATLTVPQQSQWVEWSAVPLSRIETDQNRALDRGKPQLIHGKKKHKSGVFVQGPPPRFLGISTD